MSEEIEVVEVKETEVAEAATVEAPEAAKVADTSVSMEEMKDELEKSFVAGPPADDDPVWDNFQKLLDEKTVFEVKVETNVKAGLIAMVDDVRAFIPASKITNAFVEKPEEYKGKKLDVIVINVDREKKSLVLSGRDAIRIKNRAARKEALANIKVDDVLDGKVESLKEYGAFVELAGGVSGLLHVSEISWKRVEKPESVLTVGQEIKVKVKDVKDGKVSLSMKALEERPARAERPDSDRPFRGKKGEKKEDEGPSHWNDGGNAKTSLGSLLGNIKL